MTTTRPKKQPAPHPDPVPSHAVLYPGLAELVTTLGRTLSVAGGRDVRTTLKAITPTNTQATRPGDVVRVGATPSALLEFSAGLINPLVEALMGLPARPSKSTTASSSDVRLLRTNLVPALLPLVKSLSPDVATSFRLTDDTGPKALAAVRAEHLVEVLIGVVVDGIKGELTVLLPVAPPQRATPNPDAVTALANVRVELAVTLPPVPVPAATIHALRPGSLLPLVAASTPWLLTAPGNLLGTGNLGQIDGRKALSLTTLRKENPMETPVPDRAIDDTPQTDAASLTAALDVLGDVEVAVTVEAGRISMPMHALAALREGQVLRLDRKPSTPVTVLANGRKVATAESVTLDDGQLALRILTLGDS